MEAIPIPDGSIWSPGGWRHDVRLAADPRGRLLLAHHAHGGGKRLLPGIANLHSHAFQRAMAGMAEHQAHPADSFWTWRETMYGFAARFSHDTLHAVAAQLYAEMLEAGYRTQRRR